MGYFANGTEACGYQEQYCINCKNWTKREGDYGEGCPIWDMHLMDNYDLCNIKDNYLNKLIPRSENGLSNEKCVMFLPKYLKIGEGENNEPK
jgi:hypothetical protein